MKFLKALLAVLRVLLRAVAWEWVARLIEVVRLLCSRLRRRRERHGLPGRQRKSSPDPCAGISDPAFKRPDPLIYAQHHLMKQGLAVTWDNPDIQLRRGGAAVPSDDLQGDTDYEIVARIWNNSTEAPVVGLPVEVSFLSFGAGTTSTPIGATSVNLGVKGGPNHPAFASVAWHTPPAAGHYCIQVRFEWIDDVNPDNNLGQENTTVAKAHSPATFRFQLRNDTRERRRFWFDVDTYTLPAPDPCTPGEKGPGRRGRRERPGTVREVAPRHHRMNYPVPTGWSVALDPAEPILAPGQELTIQATLTPPGGFAGRQAFNVNAFHDEGFSGGVTLYVERP